MVDWSQWSEPQLRCVLALDFAVPLHQTHLTRRHRVRGPTRESLVEAGMIRRHYLAEREREGLWMPFFTLSQAGLAVKRDYIRWHRSVRDKVGSLPPKMQAVAEAAL